MNGCDELSVCKLHWIGSLRTEAGIPLVAPVTHAFPSLQILAEAGRLQTCLRNIHFRMNITASPYVASM